MKLLTILLVLITTGIASAQEVKTVRKVVQIQREQTFHLTKVFDSRAYVSVEIPPNTVEWFIAFTSSTDKQSGGPINLLGQLTKFVDPSGLSAVAVNALITPSGTSRCDILVTDLKNRLKFMDGSDNYGVYDKISRKNITHGIIKIDGSKYKGSLEVLLFNPAYLSEIDVKIEITAVVKEQEVDNTVWSKETKQKLFDLYYSGFIKDSIDPGISKEAANCIVEGMAQEKNPEEIRKLSKAEYEDFSMKIIRRCAQMLEGGSRTPEQEKAISYGRLGWKAYENGDIDKCMEYSKKALAIDPDMGWVQANLGLCYLIKGDSTTAVDYYVGAIASNRKNRLGAKKHFETQIKDIDDALKKYPGMQGYQDIKALMQSELKRY